MIQMHDCLASNELDIGLGGAAVVSEYRRAA